MSKPYQTSKASGFQDLDNDGSLAGQNELPFIDRGVTFVPAGNVAAAHRTAPGQMAHIMLTMSRGNGGLFVALTPEGARSLIAGIERSIAEAEKYNKAIGENQLAEALRREKPQ